MILLWLVLVPRVQGTLLHTGLCRGSGSPSARPSEAWGIYSVRHWQLSTYVDMADGTWERFRVVTRPARQIPSDSVEVR